MALSSDLISQFVKATKDDTKRKQESTVYGTIVEYEGKKYAKLDGSSLLTPVTTTAAVKVGERVTVLIKNHTATVTGNISSPSASSGDVSDLSESVSGIQVSVDELGNRVLTVEEIIAGQVEATSITTNSLDATLARIDDLAAMNVNIR